MQAFDAEPPPSGDDSFAAALRGFGPAGLLAIAAIFAGNFVFIPLSALLALAWAWRSRTPWRDLGFVRPASWMATIAGGIVFGIALKLAMKSLVMPLFGAPPRNEAYQYLAHNPAALPSILYAIVVGAGFGEETLWRGYLFERFAKSIGRHPWAKAVAVVVSSVLFGGVHVFDQGVPGVQQATFVGLIYGTIYAWRGGLPLLMIAHAAFDLTALVLIYHGLETGVARWFFR